MTGRDAEGEKRRKNETERKIEGEMKLKEAWYIRDLLRPLKLYFIFRSDSIFLENENEHSFITQELPALCVFLTKLAAILYD